MTGKKIGYIRVSTEDQNPDRQLADLELDKKFIDYASGSTTKRPELHSLLNYVREDDAVFVHSLDRLARNMSDLKKLVDHFLENGIEIHFMKENLHFTGKSDPMSNLIFCVFGAVAEFEHSLIKERQAEGIAKAKREGKYLGRRKCMTPSKIEELKKLMQLEYSISKIARKLEVSRLSIYKELKTLGLK
jgi:DNA invertase Pin-like site-specific DNA recombinase